MKYRFIKRANPQNRAEEKYYAAPVNDGNVDEDDISTEISQLSSLSKGDVLNVIVSLVTIAPKYLLMNKSVSLGDLGILRVSFSSEGVENKEDFHVGMINGKKIVFRPSSKLRKMLDDMHFELDSRSKE